MNGNLSNTSLVSKILSELHKNGENVSALSITIATCLISDSRN